MIDDAKNALEELRETYAHGATACGCCAEDLDEDRVEFDRLLAIVLADNQTEERKTATRIPADIQLRGEAHLYRLSEPHEGAEFVIVSAVEFGGRPETYIFPATQDGKIADWGELPGSFQGGHDHERALANAGYGVAE